MGYLITKKNLQRNKRILTRHERIHSVTVILEKSSLGYTRPLNEYANAVLILANTPLLLGMHRRVSISK